MKRKEVEFDVEPVAMFTDVDQRIQRLSNDIYGVTVPLDGIELQRYTTPRGTKLPKVLKKAFVDRCSMDRRKLDEQWALFTTRVSELYTKEMRLWAAFGDPDEIAKGNYDTSSSCFRTGANNYACKVLYTKFHRGRVLLIERRDGEYANMDPHQRPRGRCLIYLPGGRKYYFFNFYYRNGMIESTHVWTSAMEALLGIKTRQVIRMQNRSPVAPVYINDGGPYLVKDAKAFETFNIPKFPCPTCGKKVPMDEFHYAGLGQTTFKMGCSKNCAEAFSRNPRRCSICSTEENRADPTGWYFGNDAVPGRRATNYCPRCVSENTFQCPRCSNRHPHHTARKLKDTPDGQPGVCRGCYDAYAQSFQCPICSGVWKTRPERKRTLDGASVCRECHDTRCHTCSSCGGTYRNSPGMVCAKCLPKSFATKPWQVISPRVREIVLKMPSIPDQLFTDMYQPQTHFRDDNHAGAFINEIEQFEVPSRMVQADMHGQLGNGAGPQQRAYAQLVGMVDRAESLEQAQQEFNRLRARYAEVLHDVRVDYQPGQIIAIQPEQEDANEEPG